MMDGAASLSCIAEVLRSSDYQVGIRESGKSTLEYMQTAEEGKLPNLVLCDWVMPNLSGVDLCCRLKGSADGKCVYFMFIFLFHFFIFGYFILLTSFC
ncbi:MAG: response regulator [Cyanobacteriota bacterium]